MRKFVSIVFDRSSRAGVAREDGKNQGNFATVEHEVFINSVFLSRISVQFVTVILQPSGVHLILSHSFSPFISDQAQSSIVHGGLSRLLHHLFLCIENSSWITLTKMPEKIFENVNPNV
jgi:hypothetical protein